MTIPSFITPAGESGREGDPAPYFRRAFDASAGLRRATLRITAIGVVEAWLNGNRVGDEVLAPGWTSYRQPPRGLEPRRHRAHP